MPWPTMWCSTCFKSARSKADSLSFKKFDSPRDMSFADWAIRVIGWLKSLGFSWFWKKMVLHQ